MENLKKALQGLNLRRLVVFFDSHADILHRSRYHHEEFDVHCYLVIGKTIAEYEAGTASADAVIAACLHDIAKPRTAGINKRGDACFYGHEKVTDEELAEFLDPGYPGFKRVAELIRSHMLPHGIGENTPEPWRGRNQEALQKLLASHDGAFEQDLKALARADSESSCVKDDADLPAARKAAKEIRELLLSF